MSQNFLDYTEVDPNSRITVISSRVTWLRMTRAEDAYVYGDMGVDYFSGDFTHQLTFRLAPETTVVGTLACSPWALTNIVDDRTGIKNASGDFLDVYVNDLGAPGASIGLEECDGGTYYAPTVDPLYSITAGTVYYLTLVRDESVGTYGTLYLYIYSDAGRTTLLGTQSIALHSSKKDFRHVFGLLSTNTGEANIYSSGYTENLTLYKAPAGYLYSYPTEAITRVTNLIHRYNREEGVYTLEMALGEVTSDFGLPEWLSKPQPLVPPPVVERVPYAERGVIPPTGRIPGVEFEPEYLGRAGLVPPPTPTPAPAPQEFPTYIPPELITGPTAKVTAPQPPYPTITPRQEPPMTSRIPGVKFEPAYIGRIARQKLLAAVKRIIPFGGPGR